jgi:hypothetical protein
MDDAEAHDMMLVLGAVDRSARRTWKRCSRRLRLTRQLRPKSARRQCPDDSDLCDELGMADRLHKMTARLEGLDPVALRYARVEAAHSVTLSCPPLDSTKPRISGTRWHARENSNPQPSDP